MSLKSKIQALITAANAKTGETDATLTDAVQTLVDGYGQSGAGGNYNIESVDDGNGGQILNITDAQGGGTEITDGIVVKARDANGYATEIDYYGTTVPEFTFGNSQNNTIQYIWYRLTTINFKNVVSTLGGYAFRSTKMQNLSFPDVTTISGQYCFSNAADIKTVSLPKISSIPDYTFRYDAGLTAVQLGSVGYGVTSITFRAFQGCTSAFTLTVYTTGNNVDAFVTGIRSQAADATIIIKASESTTYNGVSYAAGETMITSEVA